jgi:mannose-1-phosphate guanylyltransferase
MDDVQVVAAILTLALHSGGQEQKPKVATKRRDHVLKDYRKFLQELEKADHSIDKDGIHPD